MEPRDEPEDDLEPAPDESEWEPTPEEEWDWGD